MKLQKKTLICLGISLAIMLTALVLTLCGRGINFGLDFTGGLILNYDMGESFDTAIVEKTLGEIGVAEFAVSSSGEDGRVMQARIASLGSEDEVQLLQAALEEKLLAVYPGMDAAAATASYVGPVAGSTLVRNAISSVLLAAVLMLVYIAFRFDFASGLAAVLGLLHDVLIMLSFMVILRDLLQMNSSFIAAMLTIVGYSINNTIIIFDRIRENRKKPVHAGLDRMQMVDVSVRESLGRTINTTLTTLVTITCLYLLGVSAIREFSLPIIVGVLAGVYSANLINGYLWAALEGIGKRKK
ncbi:MAG: protein translocase subunit SecF [Clostridiales bacterium]|nr:protein translocase subunit SecF [Clostridiales bacterium]